MDFATKHVEDLDEICLKIRTLLEEAVRRNLCEGMLLSGGLDTSILAVLASKYAPIKAFTVGFNKAATPDVEYARLLSSKLRLDHVVHFFDESELHKALREVIRILRTFDPMEVRNSVVVFIGLRLARDHGVRTVMTGDGSDELFAGYSFLFNLSDEELKLKLERLWETMHFSSIPLARELGLEVRLPFLDPEFKSFAMSISPGYKVRRERGKVYGKWILRKAFEGMLPSKIVWRDKTPIEVGSGTTILPRLFDEQISDDEFEAKKREYLEKDCVIIRSKEQLFYYEIYRTMIGRICQTNLSSKSCPYCKSSVNEKATYCRTCGAYPI
ncbi:MAG: asparagine synthase-related protein [Candidatus Nezhaarchaeota archaeon]|nr:asparagine synthase-related protein [Candidatus Nezhaarchaeota archaeon]